MYISKKHVERIIDNAELEFRGCHAPHNETPLYGRRAYYMIDYVKVTFPVKSMSPRKSTLREGLIKELQRRIGEIGFRLDVSWSGYSQVVIYDGYGVMPLLKRYIDKQYLDLPFKASKKSA